MKRRTGSTASPRISISTTGSIRPCRRRRSWRPPWPRSFRRSRPRPGSAQVGGIVQYQDRRFVSSNVYAVDADFFKVFSFRLATGDPETALSEPNRLVLTRSAARRVLGGEDPMGRVLSIRGTTFTVTGIAEDCPRNSHFHFEFLTSIPTYPRSRVTGWFEGFCATYVVLKKGASPRALEAKLPEFVLNHHYGGKKDGDLFKDWIYFLQPLTAIHLHSHLLIGEFEANSSAAYVTIFFVIAVFVLLVAAVNFINLSTARSAVRGREVGIRKVCGSGRARLSASSSGSRSWWPAPPSSSPWPSSWRSCRLSGT